MALSLKLTTLKIALVSVFLVGTSMGAGFSSQSAQAVGTPPDAPTGLSAVASGTQVNVSWTNATVNFDSVTITASPGGESYTGTGSSYTFNNLTPGITYTFTGISHSVDGAGPSGPSVPSNAVMFIGAPTPPLSLTVSEVSGITTVSWTSPYSDGGTPLLSTLVTASNGSTCTASGAATSCTFSGLTAGSSYSFSATATNAQGSSAASSAVTFVVPLANTGSAPGAVLAISFSLIFFGLLVIGIRKVLNRLPITSHK